MSETYYSRNRDRILRQQKEYRHSNRDRVRMGVRCSMYGISRERLERLLKKQQGTCPVCGKPLGKKYDIDHCHHSGKVRGLLHHGCNVGLGHLKDSVVILRRAVRYLENT